MWAETPNLEKIEVGNILEKAESDLINGLKLEAFDKDAKKENIDEMKDVLKSTTINVITSATGAVEETKEQLSLIDIATHFDQYVEKGEGWKLKIKEWKTDTPAWITYIIENPKNNDLAYLVQKIAFLIEYKTAKKYTDDQMKIDTVKDDKVFGNHTRRALAGLKNWIEDTASTTVVTEWKTYEWKYIAKMFLEWVISSGKTNEEKNTALVKYNLQYKDKEIMPIDWYEFIDPNSNNYAVIKGDDKDKETGSTEKQNEETETKEDEEPTWNIEDIKKQLKSYNLESDNELITQIQTKKHNYDTLEYNLLHIAIRKWKISIYGSKEDFDKANALLKSETLKEAIKKREDLRAENIKTLLADTITYETITDASGKIVLKAIPWIFFNNIAELNNFKRWMTAVVNKFAYNSNMESPFKISKKWNIYRDNWYAYDEELYLEDAKEKWWNTYIDMKYIEDYKWDSAKYKAEVEKIVEYLNGLQCWDKTILKRPY